MSAATQQIPVVPPRPSRDSDNPSPNSTSTPRIPPRPLNKRIERSKSPAAERFARSPLNEGFAKPVTSGGFLSPGREMDDPIDRAGSVPLPGVGEEGMEYSAVADELDRQSRTASPEQTRTVADDLQLHAPRPSVPAQSAKQRVAAVTRTDSDKAASFGIGRPSQGEEGATSRDSIRKKVSTSLSATSDTQQTDDDHGIPEIGQRVPMNPNLGDVQAPSSKPDESSRNHHRKGSARSLPPGSYGLHGHGLTPQDKLEKAYYEKHPEIREREQQSHGSHEHRQSDFAMSSADLNKLVRDTANRGSGLDTGSDMRGTPTDEVGFQASEEYASRMGSPRPASTTPQNNTHEPSPLHKTTSHDSNNEPIHVDDARHPEFRSYGDEHSGEENEEYIAPILASDEVSKDVGNYAKQPAIHHHRDHREASESQTSRPTSRPSSIQFTSNPEIRHTPLEDVEEYEPLFDEETKKEQAPEVGPDENKHRRHFPSKDIWEDAPTSVHYTTEVSTPDDPEHQRKRASHHEDRPLTPAQAFAKHQEELAERESHGKSSGHKFLPLSADKPTWAAHQAHLNPTRPASGHRFPSRDIWEDTPESQLQETTVTPSDEKQEDVKPEIPSRPAKKMSDPTDRPAIPSRPKPKTSEDDVVKSKPPVTEKPKPEIPARPSKSPLGVKDGEPKQKPPVPSRPAGGKIAALQAGFLSDLNKRLQLGPQAAKKDEPEPEPEASTEKEKAPLSDARKGRARGPQRRAPAKSTAPVTEAKPASTPALTFSLPQSMFSIDDDGLLTVGDSEESEKQTEQQPMEQSTEQPDFKAVEVVDPADPEKVPEAAAVAYTEASPEITTAEEMEPQEHPAVHPPPAETESAEKSPGPEEVAQEEPKLEEKTLVANTAGENILETTVEKKEGGNEVEPKEVDDAVKP